MSSPRRGRVGQPRRRRAHRPRRQPGSCQPKAESHAYQENQYTILSFRAQRGIPAWWTAGPDRIFQKVARETKRRVPACARLPNELRFYFHGRESAGASRPSVQNKSKEEPTRKHFVTSLSHNADTHRSQKSHTIDDLLRQSWGILLSGAEDSVPEGHPDFSPQLHFKR